MRKIRSSKLYQYLKERGVLERGNEEEIQKAKKEYRKLYAKQYRKQYREQKTRFEILLNPKERKLLEKSAKEHGYSMTKYLKVAALSYISKTYVIPHPSSILELKELVYKTYNEITHIANEEKGKWLGMMNNYDVLKNRILEVYETTQATFQNPHLLEDVIQSELKNNPDFFPKLKQMIQDYDRKV